jgi:hypothetical protein
MTYNSRHISSPAFCKAAHHSRCVDGEVSVAALRCTVSHQGRMRTRDDSVTLQACEQITSTKCPSFYMTTSSLTNIRVTLKTSRTLTTCDNSLGLLILLAPEAGDFVELILLYIYVATCQICCRDRNQAVIRVVCHACHFLQCLDIFPCMSRLSEY